MIVLSHGMPDGDVTVFNSAIDLGLAPINIQYFIIGLFHNMGQIGNDIFLVCSAWFLVDSKRTNVNKIFSMIGDCFVVSIIMLAIFSIAGYRLPTTYLIKQFLPVTFGNSWFLTCYLLLYAIHPLLNIIIENIGKKNLLLLNTIFIILYCCMSFIMNCSLFFYSDYIGFIGIYFIVAYVKKYMCVVSTSKKFGMTLLALGILVWFTQNVFTIILGLKIEMFSDKVMRWNRFINPCYILISIGVFCLAKNIRFYNSFINYISSLSLLIYMFHCNRIVRDYVRFDFFKYVLQTYTYNNILLWVVIFAVISLLVGTLLAIIYHSTIQKIVHKILNRILCIFQKIYIFFERIVFNIE